ncbi:Betaine aldehyde dehydrogenase [Frankia sp. AiPs1]|uniref:aldehyde dehydrogenase family protein n=1 Tax=Frankia sp. AiPa1 TaxID=573492 RepID=UPI00202B1D87|nr:aldehyde dehydrogenase family protein [Frankia sp. AiPa1]MCL9761614.1 aldehyde dehydrogenase family protein [Frankia sp. AiPa1]
MASAGLDRTRPPVHLRIGHERIATGTAGTFDHIDPATGQVDSTIPLAGPADVDHAVQVAQEAFLRWRDTRPAERRRLLLRLSDLIEANADEFTRRAILDNGTPIGTAPALVGGAVEWTRYYAGLADKISGRVASSFGPDGEFSYTLAQPYGIIGIIITWNGPLTSLTMKIPPALAAGNTVIVKPSELTPYAAELFADLVEEAGFPPGVVNILSGSAESGARLVEHPLVKKISFTGGPTTATAILKACAAQMKPAVLELGGKSASLIFEDADIEAAARWNTMRVLGTMAGQGCGFPTRMIVHRSLYDEALERVTEIAKNIRVGDPFDTDTDIGPVINAAAVERILGLIERAERDGARLLHGGHRVTDGGLAGGYYLQPTVFADVDPALEIAQSEVFGPVLVVMPFDTEDEAIRIANSTPYGLSSYIQTKDLHRAHRVAERLDAGATMINGAPNLQVNRPFGGIGLSGYGKEGGPEGLAEFQRVKTVGIC